MRWTGIVLVLMLALLLGGPGRVAAQSTSSSGMFGNRTTGSGISAGSGSAFGSNSPLSSLGQSSGQGAPTLNNANGVGGQARQAGSFVGAYTGRTAAQQNCRRGPGQPTGGAQSGYGNSGMGGSGMGVMGMGGMGMGGLGHGASGKRALVPALTATPAARQHHRCGHLYLGIRACRGPVASGQFGDCGTPGSMPALHWKVPAQVEMRGHTAILRGVAATEHDRDLAERVVRLEATVDQVQNQIAVAAPAMPMTVSPAEQAPPAEHTPAANNSAADRAEAGNSAADNPATGSSVPRSPAAGSSAVRSSVPVSSAARSFAPVIPPRRRRRARRPGPCLVISRRRRNLRPSHRRADRRSRRHVDCGRRDPPLWPLRRRRVRAFHYRRLVRYGLHAVRRHWQSNDAISPVAGNGRRGSGRADHGNMRSEGARGEQSAHGQLDPLRRDSAGK